MRYFWQINRNGKHMVVLQEYSTLWHLHTLINGLNYLWRCRITSHRKCSASFDFTIDIFCHSSFFFFFVSKALKIDVLLWILWKLKKRKKKKFFFARWIGGTNEFLSGKIASFIGGELRSWTGLETEKYWILRY